MEVNESNPKALLVEVYRRDGCGYCHAAESLLTQLNIEYKSYDVWKEPARKEEMLARNPSATTVPQIFINNQTVGGYTDLARIYQQGELQSFLNTSD